MLQSSFMCLIVSHLKTITVFRKTNFPNILHHTKTWVPCYNNYVHKHHSIIICFRCVCTLKTLCKKRYKRKSYISDCKLVQLSFDIQISMQHSIRVVYAIHCYQFSCFATSQLLSFKTLFANSQPLSLLYTYTWSVEQKKRSQKFICHLDLHQFSFSMTLQPGHILLNCHNALSNNLIVTTQISLRGCSVTATLSCDRSLSFNWWQDIVVSPHRYNHPAHFCCEAAALSV